MLLLLLLLLLLLSSEKQQERAFNLVASAYTSIRADDLAAFMGMPVDSAISGWSHVSTYFSIFHWLQVKDFDRSSSCFPLRKLIYMDNILKRGEMWNIRGTDRTRNQYMPNSSFTFYSSVAVSHQWMADRTTGMITPKKPGDTIVMPHPEPLYKPHKQGGGAQKTWTHWAPQFIHMTKVKVKRLLVHVANIKFSF